MSAAGAAGVSVAFGAPIGGVLFSLEEVSYYFPPKTMWRSFFCALIAAVTLKIIDPFGTGKLVRFQVNYDSDWHYLELISFFILGAFGVIFYIKKGFFGACFIKTTKYLEKFKNMYKLSLHPLIEVFIVSIITGFIRFGNEFTR